MDSKKIVSVIVIVIGAILLLFSDYIANEVAAGKLRIQQGQQSVNTVDSLFSSSQYTKPIGKEFTRSSQRKIDAGRSEVARYGALANQLQIAGIILIIVGIGMFFLWKNKRS